MKKIFEAKVIQVGPEAQNMIQDAICSFCLEKKAPEELSRVLF